MLALGRISYVGISKVEVTFYLWLRNEFKPFPTKKQAFDWLIHQFNQLEAWFFAGNSWNSFIYLRLKVTKTLGGNVVLLCRYSVQSLLLIIIDTKSWNNKWNCHESQQWKKKVWNQPRRNWKWQTCQFKSIFPWKSWGTMCFDVVKCKAKVFWERRKNRTLLCPFNMYLRIPISKE